MATKIYPAEGHGAHIRSVVELAQEVDDLAQTTISAILGRGLILSKSVAPPIPLDIHDGTAATEVTVPFGNDGDDYLEMQDGVFTVLQTITSVISLFEIHVTRTGGGPTSIFTFWIEMSIDGGATWTPFEDSLRSNEVANDGDGIINADLSLSQPAPPGVKFRIRATNTGSGSLAIAAPDSITTSNGVVGGFKTKFSGLYAK